MRQLDAAESAAVVSQMQLVYYPDGSTLFMTTSGINAIAHAVEALYAREQNPITSLMALEAIRSLSSALPRISADPSDKEARTDALYGAWLSGTCLGTVGMALHHKLCHVLGGSFKPAAYPALLRQ